MAETTPAAASQPAQPLLEGVTALPETGLALTRELWAWLSRDSYAALVAIGAALPAYLLLELLLRLFGRHLARGAPGSYRRMLAGVAGRTLSLFLLLVPFKVMTALTAPPPLWTRTIGFLFTVVVVIQLARWAIALVSGLIDRRSETEGGLDPDVDSAVGVLRVVVHFAVWVIAGIALLDNLGVNVTALVAGLGIGGIAIGLAAQGIFSDLFAALAIIIDRPFRKGDFISLGGPQGPSGTVEHIGLKSTRIRALSGELISLSNAQLLNQQIANFAEVRRRRAVLAVELLYQTPPELLERVPGELQAIVEDRPRCTFDRATLVRLGPSGLIFELVFFVEDDALPVFLAEQHAVILGIIRRLGALGIGFAFPSQTVYLAGPDGAAVDLAGLAAELGAKARPEPKPCPQPLARPRARTHEPEQRR